MRIRQQANRFWWVVAMLTWLSFLILAMGVHFHASWIGDFDAWGQQLAIGVRQPSRTIFFKWFALLGTPSANTIICLLVSLILWLRHRRFEAGWVLTAQVGINALMAIFKMIMQWPYHFNCDDGIGHPFDRDTTMSLSIRSFLTWIDQSFLASNDGL